MISEKFETYISANHVQLKDLNNDPINFDKMKQTPPSHLTQ